MLTDRSYEAVLADNRNYQDQTDQEWIDYIRSLGFLVRRTKLITPGHRYFCVIGLETEDDPRSSHAIALDERRRVFDPSSRASGPGGQGVNTTDSAVQVLHKPTGLIVRCADGRSQQKNKQQAFTVLRSRLLEQKIAEENAKYAAQRKAQVGTGERNERIRTYNFPQNRVTDHRIELTLYNLSAVIDGDLDPLIEPLMAHDLEQRLAASAR